MKLTILRLDQSLLLCQYGFDVEREAAGVRASITVVPTAGWLAFDSQLTVAQNLSFWARLYGLDRRKTRERVREALAVVGLVDWHDETPDHLSSGMRQRLAIAKGLLFRAPIFILDEPTAHVDPSGAYQIRDFIRNELNRQLGQTVVLTTHNMAEAEQLCDRVVIIDRGRVVACDRPTALVSTLEDRVVEVALSSGAERAIQLLRNQKLALHLADFLNGQGAGRVRFHLHPGASVARIREVLDQAGIAAIAHPTAATLEDVFLHHTGRKLDGDSTRS